MLKVMIGIAVVLLIFSVVAAITTLFDIVSDITRAIKEWFDNLW